MVIIIRTLKQYDSELSGFGALIDGHWIKAKNGFRFGLGLGLRLMFTFFN